MMKKHFFLAIFVALPISWHLLAVAHADDKATKSKFKVGQVWSYKTRPSEKSSTFVVWKVENDGKNGVDDNIIHIAVRGLKMKNRKENTTNIAFLPIYERALKQSAPHLLKEKVKSPEIPKEYRYWRKSRDEGRGGVYTVPLANCIALYDELYRT